MNDHILHLQSPAREDGRAHVAGNRGALLRLRAALDDAIATGTGGTFLYAADGEGFTLAVLRVDDMNNVCTSYAADQEPVRSLRETDRVEELANYHQACIKAVSARRASHAETGGGPGAIPGSPPCVPVLLAP